VIALVPRRVLPARQARAVLALLAAVSVIVGAIWLVDGGAAPTDESTGSAVRLGGSSGSGVTPRIGEAAPEFTLARLSGEPLALSDLRGQPVIVNFWASWCPPCRGEMPDLEDLAREQRASGLTVIAVNLDEESAAVQRYATALDLTLPIGLDRGGRVSALYNLVALPTSFFVDRQGVVRDLNIGALTARGLRTKVARILD
jgi:cytochrome c biogenesis protein CcmG, thiol:disulfide interchange protein DsbE